MAYIKNEPTEFIYKYTVEKVGIPTLSRQMKYNRNQLKEIVHNMGFNQTRAEDLQGNKEYVGKDYGAYSGLLSHKNMTPDEIKEQLSDYINWPQRGTVSFDRFLTARGINPKTGARIKQTQAAGQTQTAWQTQNTQFYPMSNQPPTAPQFQYQQTNQMYETPQPQDDKLDLKTKILAASSFVLIIAIFVLLSYITNWSWWIKLIISLFGAAGSIVWVSDKINNRK